MGRARRGRRNALWMARVELLPPSLVSSSICHEIVGFFSAIFLCALAGLGEGRRKSKGNLVPLAVLEMRQNSFLLDLECVLWVLRDLGRSGEGEGPEKKKKQSVTTVNRRGASRAALGMMVRGASHVRRTPRHVPATNRGVFSA